MNLVDLPGPNDLHPEPASFYTWSDLCTGCADYHPADLFCPACDADESDDDDADDWQDWLGHIEGEAAQWN